MNDPAPTSAADLARYHRQVIYGPIGEAGQRRLLESRVVLIGCGALGTVLADTMTRAGIGHLRLVDRDYVELNNLQRQVLFDEADAAAGNPKAVAAAEALRRINSMISIEPVVADADPANIEDLVRDAHLILDGTDNFETRFLINDVAVKHRLPWVYGACVAGTGMVMPILPGETPCLRCIWEQPPPPGISPTCDTAGILGPVVHLVAALQSIAAIQILTGQTATLNRRLVQVEAWEGRFEQFDMSGAKEAAECPTCKLGRFDYLSGAGVGRSATLCGRDAVQIGAPPGTRVDFEEIARRVAAVARRPPTLNRFLLRFEVDSYQITLFPDGRAIIKGTHELDRARNVYARYIGS